MSLKALCGGSQKIKYKEIEDIRTLQKIGSKQVYSKSFKLFQKNEAT